MSLWEKRFNTKYDECIHLVIGLTISNILEAHEYELVNSYGEEIVEKAKHAVRAEYSSLLARF